MEYLFKPEIADDEFNQRIINIDALIASGVRPKKAFKLQGFIKEEFLSLPEDFNLKQERIN